MYHPEYRETPRASTTTTLSLKDERPATSPNYRGNGSTPKKVLTTGHDVILRAFQQNGCTATIVTINGEGFSGVVVGRDKFTITLLINGIRHIFYKHAIEQFYSIEQAGAAKQS